eukprot:TRINITY_DN4344_c0_g1_i2.p1 TRINITY_DN4344_c0_g1~~TRINITY_DN4344_c0_g1_i2.p1  ORF type:complete len:2179 (-),score=456.78 TRINITY_DN4344_c0_g1_i2:43-6579(-)
MCCWQGSACMLMRSLILLVLGALVVASPQAAPQAPCFADGAWLRCAGTAAAHFPAPLDGFATSSAALCGLVSGFAMCVPRSEPGKQPTVVARGVKQLAAGLGGVCALVEGGSVRCWTDGAGTDAHAVPLEWPCALLGGGDLHVCALGGGATEGAVVIVCWKYGEEAGQIQAMLDLETSLLPDALTVELDQVCASRAASSVVCAALGPAGSGRRRAPALASVAPALVAPGGVATLAGSGFGTALSDVHVFLNGVECTVASVVDTEVVIGVPWMLPRNYSAWVSVVGVESGVVAVEVGGESGFKEVRMFSGVTASTFCLGVPSAGVLFCWGSNVYGSLGVGLDSNANPSDRSIGDEASELPLTLQTDVGGPYIRVFLGGLFGCVLTATASVRCWGNNNSGQLGYGHQNQIGAQPGEMPPPEVGTAGPVAELALFSESVCALLHAGDVQCWGSNSLGQLGLGTTVDSLAPAAATNLTGYVVASIAAGSSHACLLSTAGQVACWGYNYFGQLGIGSSSGANATIGNQPGEMPPRASRIGGSAVAVVCGFNYVCAVLSSGEVKCWGEGINGALGVGSTSNIGDAQAEMPPGSISFGSSAAVRTLHPGNSMNCALLETGDATCWGSNGNEALGLVGVIIEKSPPASAVPLGTSKIHTLAASALSLCGLETDGGVKCWGDNQDGQLGIGSTTSVGYDVGDMPPRQARVPPLLGSVLPTTMSVGGTLTLLGAGFGSSAANVSVWVGGVACPVTVATPLHVECAPTYTIGSFLVTAVRAGFGSSNAVGPIVFPATETRTRTRTRTRTATQLIRPWISGVSPRGGKAGDTVTLSGTGFGSGADVTVVTVGGAACAGLVRTPTELLCTLPAAVSLGEVPVRVTRDGMPDQDGRTVVVVSSFGLAGLSPPEGQAGTAVNISALGGAFGGTNGLAMGEVAVVVTSTSGAEQAALVLEYGGAWLTVAMPVVNSSAAAVTVAVRVVGAPWTSNNSLVFTYIATPVLQGVFPPKVTGGGRLTLSGSGFGTDASALSVAVGGSVCEVGAASDGEVECTVGRVQAISPAAAVAVWRYTTVASSTVAVEVVSERAALVALYGACGGPGWLASRGWLNASVAYCEWAGVVCAPNQINVVGLDISRNNAVGSLPAEIGDFYFLSFLNISTNRVGGELRAEVCSNTRLRSLDVSSNQLTSSIPACLGASALVDLDLSRNNLTGSIPETLGQLTTLRTLRLGENRLEGSIPSGFRGLELLDVFGNRLSGAVPTIGVGSLQQAYLGTNRFTGVLPATLCSLGDLQAGCNFFSSVCFVAGKQDASADCTRRGATLWHIFNTCERDGEYVGLAGLSCVSNCGAYEPTRVGATTVQCRANVTCTHGCAMCNGAGLTYVPENCTRCDSALGFALSLDGSECVGSCGAHQSANFAEAVPQCQCDYASGWFPDAGRTACRSCPSVNQYFDSDNSCKDCHSDCVTCTGPSAGDCLACPFGVELRSAGTGGGCTGTCSTCKATFVRSNATNSCVCPQGTSLQSGSCIGCPVDTFCNTTGLSNVCAFCPAHSTTAGQSSRAAASDCVCRPTFTLSSGGGCECPAGALYDSSSGVCQPCPVDSYSDSVSLAGSCLSCRDLGAHLTTGGLSGRNKTADCVCPPTMQRDRLGGGCVCAAGFYFDFGTTTCRQCGADSYNDAPSTSPTCTPCGLHRSTRGLLGASNRTVCVCAPGYISGDGDDCLDCLSVLGPAAVCDGGSVGFSANQTRTEAAGLRAGPGYWLTTKSEFLGTEMQKQQQAEKSRAWFLLVKCPVRAGCPGGQEEACAVGYTGPACGVCAEGFGQLGAECARCPSAGVSSFLVVLVLALALVGCALVVRFSRSTETVDGEESGSNLNQRVKIAITHLQIIGFTANFSSQWPEILVRVFAVPVSAATVSSASDNISIECTTNPSLYVRAVLIFLLPLILAAGVALGYGLAGVRWGFSDLGGKIKQGTLVLLYVAHPGIFQGVLALLVCYPVGSEHFARSDMSVSCADPGFVGLQAAAAIYLTVYGFGGLGAVFFMMRRDPDTFKFLTKGYKPKRYFWDLVVTFRKMVFVTVSLLASAPLQLFFGNWILLLSWVAHQHFEPHESAVLHRMEAMSLWVLLLTVTTGMLFYTGVFAADADGLTVSLLLILLNFGAVVVFLLLAAHKALKTLFGEPKSSKTHTAAELAIF